MEPPDGSGIDALLSELSRLLWRQRSLIEVLSYRLEVQQFISVGERQDRLAFALEEVESALDDIRRSERLRAAVVRRCALALGLDERATLTQIRERVPDPWNYMLGDHQSALLALVAGAERLSARNRELAQRGLADTEALFEALTGERQHSTYGRPAARQLTSASPTLLDRDA